MDGLHTKCPSKNSGVEGMRPSCCRFGNGFINSRAMLNSGAVLGNISEKSEVHLVFTLVLLTVQTYTDLCY